MTEESLKFESSVNSDEWREGFALLQAGEVEQAIEKLHPYVGNNPTSFEGNNFLGIALARAGRPEEAIAYLTRATELKPQSAQGHYNLGLAYVGSDRAAEARVAFETAIEIDPNYSVARKALELAQSTPGNAAWDGIAGDIKIELLCENSPGHEAEVRSTAVTAVPASTTRPSRRRQSPVLYGFLAAITGAIIWERITFYTGYQLDVLIMGIGLLVGAAFSGAPGRLSPLSARVYAIVLAGCGIFGGQTLIIAVYLQNSQAFQGGATSGDL